jgi:3-oxoacyl-(acyl-carrier-protein) synthase
LVPMHILSPDGCCKTFDTSADGFGRSEACGAVILEGASNQMHAQLAVPLEGIATNHDGRSASFMAPNGPAQVAVICAALKEANNPEGHVEIHGTGTSLGDTIEFGALCRVFYTHSVASPIDFATFKTHAAHSEGASGILAIVKPILEVQQGNMSPSLHLKNRNMMLDMGAIPCVLPSQAEMLLSNTAGVSSFGYSGTNAHCIVTSNQFFATNSFCRIHYQHKAFRWWETSCGTETEFDEQFDQAQFKQREQVLEHLMVHKSTSLLCTIQALLIVALRQQINVTLGLEDPMMQMGVTSRIAVNLTSQLQAKFRGVVKLNAVTMMNNPTIQSLTEHMVDQLEAADVSTVHSILEDITAFVDSEDYKWREQSSALIRGASEHMGALNDEAQSSFPDIANVVITSTAASHTSTPSTLACAHLEDLHPVAVTGLGFRLPVDVTTLWQFWDALSHAKAFITASAPERWIQKCKDAGLPSAALVGAFLEPGLHTAATGSSNVSAPESKLRSEEHIGILMSVLHDAFYCASHAKSTTNQDIGIFTAADAGNFEQPVASFMLARMVAWMLQTIGPAINTDAACSSGYLAISRALDCIHMKKCDRAAVGAVSLIRNPQHAQNLLLFGMMSTSGNMCPLDDSADGMIAGV